MITVGVWGATGRMGRLLVAGALADPELALAHALVREDAETPASLGGVALTPLSSEALADCEVVIDFSLPEGTERLLERIDAQALVVGTTGLDAALMARLADHARRAPVVYARNFSTGVTLLTELVARAAAALPGYDLEIVEMHHRHKRDAPSGTARARAEAAAGARGGALEALARFGREGETGARPDGEIGLHALRGGDVAGEHTVYLAGPGERLQLGHLATSRQAFAGGALRAARWVAGKPPGLYSMRDVLGS